MVAALVLGSKKSQSSLIEAIFRTAFQYTEVQGKESLNPL